MHRSPRIFSIRSHHKHPSTVNSNREQLVPLSVSTTTTAAAVDEFSAGTELTEPNERTDRGENYIAYIS